MKLKIRIYSLIMTLIGIFLYAAPPGPPGGTGGSGPGGRPKTPIDMYEIGLLVVAVLLIVYFLSVKRKKIA